MRPTEAELEARRRMLYLVACGAPPAAELPDLIGLAQADGWDVAVVATPAGSRFLPVEAVVALTGRPVRVAWRSPGEADPFPPADVILVAPATLTTIAKFRHAIADTLAVGILCEALGDGTPILLAPNIKATLARHPALDEHLRVLQSWGVHVAGQALVSDGWRLPAWGELVGMLRRLPVE